MPTDHYDWWTFLMLNLKKFLFYYDGIQYALPFKAVFPPVMLPCLKEAAVLQMEAKIEDILFQANGFESW